MIRHFQSKALSCKINKNKYWGRGQLQDLLHKPPRSKLKLPCNHKIRRTGATWSFLPPEKAEKQRGRGPSWNLLLQWQCWTKPLREQWWRGASGSCSVSLGGTLQGLPGLEDKTMEPPARAWAPPVHVSQPRHSAELLNWDQWDWVLK